jgi:Tfp pilus assembly protein PilN
VSSDRSKFQLVVYLIFLVSCAMASVLGLLVIWGVEPRNDTGVLLMRLLGTCVLLAIASALTISTTRLATGRGPKDDDL